MAKQKTKAPEDEVELEDLEETVDEAEPKKGKAQEVEFGVSDLCAVLSKKTGKKVTPRELRSLIRKMAREDKPRVDREVIPGNRSRYDWPGGLENPEVKAIIKAVTGGEMEADKQAKLAELKERKAKKDATTKGKAKGKGKKAAKVEEPEDEEVEEIEVEDD